MKSMVLVLLVLFSCKPTEMLRVKVYTNDLVTQTISASVKNLRTNETAKLGKTLFML